MKLTFTAVKSWAKTPTLTNTWSTHLNEKIPSFYSMFIKKQMMFLLLCFDFNKKTG